MSNGPWKYIDEWIDHEASEHHVLAENSDTKARHILIYPFGVWRCTTCGNPKDTPEVDFEAHKQRVIDQLNADHKKRINLHLSKFKHVRLGKGPKK